MKDSYRKQFRSYWPFRGIAATALLMVAAGAAQEPESKKAAESRPNADTKTTVPPADVAARIAAFVADKDGKQAHDFPAWNDYREVVGDTPDSRRLFAEMLRAEPELCAAIGSNPKRVARLVDERVKRLKERPKAIVEGNRLVGFRPNMGDVATIILVAGQHDVASLVDEQAVYALLRTAEIVANVVPETNGFKLKDWLHPDPEMSVVKRLASRWVLQGGDPKSLRTRFDVLALLNLEDARIPLFLRLLRRPDAAAVGRYGRIERAVLTVRDSGKKEYRSLLAKQLGSAYGLDYHYQPPCRRGVDPQLVHLTQPQLRDLALGVIVELSGQQPEKYGFIKGSSPGNGRPVYLFQTLEERNQAFAMAIKNYRELGLEKPPKYTPEVPPRFLFVMGTNRGDLRPSLTSPDGKMRLELRGNKARVVDVATGKPIGKELDAGKWEGPGADFTFTCASFSPDGKYVVTGSRFVEKFPKEADTVNTNVGNVEVWDAATGAPVEKQSRGRIGSVRAVTFSKDGKIVYYDADAFSLDIS